MYPYGCKTRLAICFHQAGASVSLDLRQLGYSRCRNRIKFKVGVQGGAGSGRIAPIRRFSLPNRPEVTPGDALVGGEGLLDGGEGGVAAGGERGKPLALLGLALAHFGRRGLDGDAGITNKLVLGTVNGGEEVRAHDTIILG